MERRYVMRQKLHDRLIDSWPYVTGIAAIVLVALLAFWLSGGGGEVSAVN